MTEERFGQIIEDVVERAADKLDHSINRAWKYKPVRFVGKCISWLSGIGLIALSFPLYEKGHNLAAKICLISGGIVIAVNVLRLLIFKKE